MGTAAQKSDPVRTTTNLRALLRTISPYRPDVTPLDKMETLLESLLGIGSDHRVRKTLPLVKKFLGRCRCLNSL